MLEGLINNDLYYRIQQVIDLGVIFFNLNVFFLYVFSIGDVKKDVDVIEYYVFIYNLERWNKYDLICMYNNCYNYVN